jgi:hypothetical protein
MTSDIFQIQPNDALIQQAVSELNSKGFFSIQNAISPEVLEQYRNEIQRLLKIKGERYFSLINPCKEPDSAFKALSESQNFNRLMRILATLGTSKDVSKSKMLNVLRVVTGSKADERSLQFHFDATVITVLIPIFIPDNVSQKSGHLVAALNLRSIRSSAFINLIEKLFFQNLLVQKLTAYFLLRNKNERHMIKLQPGNIYFFWGYRTLHANLPIDPKVLRATLIFHLGNPHENSLAIKTIAKLRHLREKFNAR